ncbi:hypothetical protein PGT21_017024 [Puccinia graminis f. sp. tritici]|uniref:Uncharacterized protein n=1 Tax=Puccinia graminis f. sp. tritici TaxID=56615 RepID=A0A5B0QFM8_PUCGR|nr:hypothetical protein PGT21_017024 [Puccinia graminis f. sp. tritici]
MDSFSSRLASGYRMNLHFQRILVLGLINLTSMLNMALGIPMKGNASMKTFDVLRNHPSRTGERPPILPARFCNNVLRTERDHRESAAAFATLCSRVENPAIVRSSPSRITRVEKEHQQSSEAIKQLWLREYPRIKMVQDFYDVEQSYREARARKPNQKQQKILNLLEEQLRRIQSLLLEQKYHIHGYQFPKGLLVKLFRNPSGENYAKDILSALKDILLASTHGDKNDSLRVMNLCRKSAFLAINLVMEYAIASYDDLRLIFKDDKLAYATLAYRFLFFDPQSTASQLAWKNAQIALLNDRKILLKARIRGRKLQAAVKKMKQLQEIREKQKMIEEERREKRLTNGVQRMLSNSG